MTNLSREWLDAAHDAGYRGEEARQAAAMLEEQEREKYEQREEDLRSTDTPPKVEFDDLVAMLKECKEFIGGVAIADERGDQWRWELYPRLKHLLLTVNSGG